MIREWADDETREIIDEALTPDGVATGGRFSDEDAWASFQAAMD